MRGRWEGEVVGRERRWRRSKVGWVGGCAVGDGGRSVGLNCWRVGVWRHDRRKGSGKKERVREGGTQVSGRHEGVRKKLKGGWLLQTPGRLTRRRGGRGIRKSSQFIRKICDGVF